MLWAIMPLLTQGSQGGGLALVKNARFRLTARLPFDNVVRVELEILTGQRL